MVQSLIRIALLRDFTSDEVGLPFPHFSKLVNCYWKEFARLEVNSFC